MNKKMWLIVLAAVIVCLGVYLFIGTYASRTDHDNTSVVASFDPLNATYVIEGQSITLINGKAEAPAAPGSAEQVTTTVFGQPTTGDLNGDGKPDAAVMLVQDTGGSGTFYYIAAAISTSNGAEGTNAILLGDRIAPQNVEIQNGQIIANYADRKPGEPMSTPPSVGVSRYFIDNGSVLRTASAI